MSSVQMVYVLRYNMYFFEHNISCLTCGDIFCFLCAFQLTTVARLTSSSVPITAAYPRGGFVMEPMTVEIMKMSLIKHAQVELYSLIHIKQIHPPISTIHITKSFYNCCVFFIFIFLYYILFQK